MTVFAICWACGAANGNNPESATAIADMPEDSISVFAESDAGTVVDEQTEIGVADTDTVSAGCAGPFKIGAPIPEVLDGFTVMKSKEEKTLPDGGGVRDIPVYFYEIGNMWDAVNEVIKELDVFEEGELPVTGWEVEIDDVIADPGMEGLGIIEHTEVEEILQALEENRDEAADIEPEDLMSEVEPEEIMEAYDNLCSLYEEALRQKKGLLLTF